MISRRKWAAKGEPKKRAERWEGSTIIPRDKIKSFLIALYTILYNELPPLEKYPFEETLAEVREKDKLVVVI